MMERTRCFTLAGLCLTVAVFAAACDGDDDDDGTQIDAGGEPEPDAAAQPDAAPTPDAAVTPDASEVTDAGTATPEEVCAVLCPLLAECFDEDPDPSCNTACTAALGDCTTEDLGTLAACAAEPCGALEECIVAVECADDDEPVCGDGQCGLDEDCESCPEDCGECVCGDGVCSVGECSTCEEDCPDGCECHDECAPGGPLDPSCSECSATVCDADPFCCEEFWDEACRDTAVELCDIECPVVCGDFICDEGENVENCPVDCSAECGDGLCTDGFEDCFSCADDCGACVCGDGTCNLGECANCEDDCPGGCVCPHDVCNTGELLDPGCGECEATICGLDPFCCTDSWDGICRSEAVDICGVVCPVECGDGFCEADETCESCPAECCEEGLKAGRARSAPPKAAGSWLPRPAK